MKPTDILTEEHTVILRVLDCLEHIAAEAERAGALDGEPAEQAVRFLRGFADEIHHGKEEARLFPAMERKGLPREAGPIAVMLHEHDLGRAEVRGMAESIPTARSGDAAALRQFVTCARGFVALLREHIGKENDVLFPMADALFTPDEQARLLEEFRAVEAQEIGPGVRADLLALADGLAQRYGVGDPTPPGSPCGGSAPTHPCSHHHRP